MVLHIVMSKMIGSSLPEDAYQTLRSRIPTVVVATVSANGYPNTTPVHLIWARDRTTLVMGVATYHQATKNIKKNPRVMISLCDEGDVNVSIRGDAKIIKEPLDCNDKICAVEVDIIDIKDDSTHSITTTGIRYKCRTEKGEEFIKGVFNELEKMKIKKNKK